MLRRWPAHGPGAPDPEALADTLATFVQFLRSTGRMGSGSGDPKVLAKEARRAAPKMVDACADRGAHSHGKVLADFGSELGIDLEGAASMEDLQGQLNRLMAEWNSLPEEERIGRMPLTSAAPGVHSGTGAFPGSGGVAEEMPVLRGDPARSAEQARNSPFVQSCLRLAQWLAPSKKVTEIGVLRLAPAEAAYRELELWRWQEGNNAIDDGSETARTTGVGKQPLFWWKSAADAAPLERVWYSAILADLIDLRATVARPTDRRPSSDAEWVRLACTTFLGLWESADELWVSRAPMLSLFGSALLGDARVSRGELVQMWARHPDNYWGGLPLGGHLTAEAIQGKSEAHLDRSLHWFADTGVWTREGDAFTLTDLGRDIGGLVFTLLDEGELDP